MDAQTQLNTVTQLYRVWFETNRIALDQARNDIETLTAAEVTPVERQLVADDDAWLARLRELRRLIPHTPATLPRSRGGGGSSRSRSPLRSRGGGRRKTKNQRKVKRRKTKNQRKVKRRKTKNKKYKN